MSDPPELLRRTAELAADYVASLEDRPVYPHVEPHELRAALGGPLPNEPLEAEQILDEEPRVAGVGVLRKRPGDHDGFRYVLRLRINLERNPRRGRRS